MYKDILDLEQFLHKHTGVEFTFDKNERVSGLQCTNPKKFKQFIKSIKETKWE